MKKALSKDLQVIGMHLHPLRKLVILEGGGGGFIVAAGTPEDIANVKNSYTAKYLKPYLQKHAAETEPVKKRKRA